MPLSKRKFMHKQRVKNCPFGRSRFKSLDSSPVLSLNPSLPSVLLQQMAWETVAHGGHPCYHCPFRTNVCKTMYEVLGKQQMVWALSLYSPNHPGVWAWIASVMAGILPEGRRLTCPERSGWDSWTKWRFGWVFRIRGG